MHDGGAEDWGCEGEGWEMRKKGWTVAPVPQSHKYLAKGLAIYLAFNEEPLKVFEQESDMARAQMCLSSLTFFIPLILCLV